VATIEPRYFFIIGAMKAGTTSLYKYLADHPHVYASPRKEPRVFREYDDPVSLRRHFDALFEGRRAQGWCFEASTAYTKYPRIAGIPKRLHSVVPDARFVYLVRNPVMRAWSHYVHNLAFGRDTRPFSVAVSKEPHYLDVSRYHLQLTQYLEVFPRDQILVQVFEEMVKDPAATVRSVCEFLEIDASYTPPRSNIAFNASTSKLAAARPLRMARRLGTDRLLPWRLRNWLKTQGAPLPAASSGLTPDLRAQIAASLRQDTEAFFELIGRRIPSWLDFA
jgi:hypothetical protein